VRQTELGRTGLRISTVGLGAWAIGGGEWQGGWGPQDDDASIAAIEHAVSRGVNWIDTAAAYGLGRAEEVVGRAVRGLPEADRPLVFTKCGLVWDPDVVYEPGGTQVSNVLAPDSIRKECDDSLRRLGVDVIDLFQIHWPSEDGTPIEESWATMVELVDAGKVRFIGVSNFEVELLEACEAIRHVDTFQPQLSMLVREAIDTTLQWCQEHGTGVIVYSPMGSGLLTGAFTAERAAALPVDDWRKDHEEFSGPGLERNLRLVERLRDVADRLDCTVPELVVAWTLAVPGVDGAIVGARNPSQVDGWIGAGDVRLSDKDLDDIAAALAETGAGAGPTHPGAAR
jgi:aryl-alcohol dehydrogenase-like predicted oxidoreductase